MQSYQAWLLDPSRLLVVVSQTPSYHRLVFGTHLAKVAVVDLLPITDHIKDQIVVEVDEDISFFLLRRVPSSRTNERCGPTKMVVADWLFFGRSKDHCWFNWWRGLEVVGGVYIQWTQGGRKGVMGGQAFELIDRRVWWFFYIAWFAPFSWSDTEMIFRLNILFKSKMDR